MVALGTRSRSIVNRELQRGAFRAIDRGVVWTFTALVAVLAIVTIVLPAENL